MESTLRRTAFVFAGKGTGKNMPSDELRIDGRATHPSTLPSLFQPFPSFSKPHQITELEKSKNLSSLSSATLSLPINTTSLLLLPIPNLIYFVKVRKG